MPIELLATCWTHAGDAVPVAGRHLSPLDLRARAEAVAAAGFTGIGFTINDLEAAKATYDLPQVKRICDDLGLVHLEVELLENWWTTGSRRRKSDQTRRSLLTAAEVLGARQIKIGPDAEVVADASYLRKVVGGLRGFEIVDGEPDAGEAGGGDGLRPGAKVQRTQVPTGHRRRVTSMGPAGGEQLWGHRVDFLGVR